MDYISYILLWAVLIFVVMKYGCGFHSLRHGHKKSGQNKGVGASKSNGSMRWAPPEKDVDPVCKKVVYTEKSKPSVHNGDVYFFAHGNVVKFLRQLLPYASAMSCGWNVSEQRSIINQAESG